MKTNVESLVRTFQQDKFASHLHQLKPRLLKMLKGTTLEKLNFGHILDAADDIDNAVEVCMNEGSQITNKPRHEKTGCWGL